MASLNKVQIIGRLGRDPEARATQSGLTVSNFSVATTYKSKQGEETEWFKVTFFDRLAEVCNQYLAKGSLVYVEGRLRTNKYTDRDGIERYQTEVVGERMQMLGGRDDGQSSGGQQGFQSQGKAPGSDYAKAKGGAKQPESFDDLDDDLPF